MRRSDLVQHKEREKARPRALSDRFWREQHLLGFSIPWRNGAADRRMQQERRILEELIHARTRFESDQYSLDEKIGLVLSSDAKPEMLEKLVKQAPEEDFTCCA